MGNITSILITGAGAPGIAGTIYSVKNNPDNNCFNIITVDIKDNVVGKYMSDKFYHVPPPERNEYIEVLRDIVVKENVKVIIPQTTREIMMLSKHKEYFSDLGIIVVVSGHESIRNANNKLIIL